jgi:prevent-host-death family protein
MRHKIISISKAKARLLEIARKVNEEGDAYLLTKNGAPYGVLVPLEEYEALLETALQDERKGRLWKRDRHGKWIKAKKRVKTV